MPYWCCSTPSMTLVIKATPKNIQTSSVYLNFIKVTFSLEYVLFKIINFPLTSRGNSFGNLPYFVLLIFLSTEMFCASLTVIRLSLNENFRHHNNFALQVSEFLYKLPCFLFFTFSTKGFNLAIQVLTVEMNNYGSYLNSLWYFKNNHVVRALISNSTA